MIQYQLPSDGLRARKVAHDSLEWNIQMVQLLRKLISSLSDTIGAWDEFRGRELGYFLPDNSPHLDCSMNVVDKAFRNMNGILSKLQKLEKELCQDSPQGVSTSILLLKRRATCVTSLAMVHADKNSSMLILVSGTTKLRESVSVIFKYLPLS
jgi:hypothetical protein